MITLQINGESFVLVESATVEDMVAELDLAAPTLLVEHNGKALHRSEWKAQSIAPGDAIEILRVAAGG